MQEEIVNAALEGKDVLAILPTGGGKSVCFQLPSLMKEGIALVVTPLIALMKDQVQNLRNRGIRALAVHAGMTRHEVDLTLNNAAYGDFKFLYISPERLSTRLFQSYVDVLDVNFIVVDEAHCISQWGYDFRPDYLEIGRLRDSLDAPIIALTATATPTVAEDIMEKLCFREKLLLKSGFERPNLSYIVRKCENKEETLLNICSSVRGSGIVYVRSRKKCQEIAGALSAQGISASFYHAGLGHQTRSERQAEWKAGRIRVMACTNAFGMGIDKPDVRFVVHMDLPDSPEAYFQEAGRAGRDGLKSYAVILWNGLDIRRLKQIGNVSFPSLEYIADVYQKVHAFFGIQYDTGEGRLLRFDLSKFCAEYHLEKAHVFYSIRYLERAGHWTYTDEMDVPTRVRIRVGRTRLYEVELPDRKMALLLDLLMRKCENIFDYAVSIDESYFSKRLGISEMELRELLYKLSVLHLVNYIPQEHSDLISLTHDRWRPGNVALYPERYEFLRKNYFERVKAMQDYVSEEDTCRSQYLLSYFGQDDSKPCGTCDVCRSNSAAIKNRLPQEIKEFVLAKDGKYTLEEFSKKFRTPEAPDGAVEVLRSMIDSGTLPPPVE